MTAFQAVKLDDFNLYQHGLPGVQDWPFTGMDGRWYLQSDFILPTFEDAHNLTEGIDLYSQLKVGNHESPVNGVVARYQDLALKMLKDLLGDQQIESVKLADLIERIDIIAIDGNSEGRDNTLPWYHFKVQAKAGITEQQVAALNECFSKLRFAYEQNSLDAMMLEP